MFGFHTGYILTSEAVGQRQHSFAETKAVLSRHSLSECLSFIGEISRKHFWVMCHGGWTQLESELDCFISIYLPTRRGSAAIEIKNPSFIAPICNHALLNFAFLACYNSQRFSSTHSDLEKVRHELFSVLLSIQGRLLGEIPQDANFPRIFPDLCRHTMIEQRLQRSWSCDIGRLHAMLTVSDVEKRLQKQFPSASIDSFFKNGIGVTGREFQVAANTTFGAVFYGADFGRLPNDAPKIAKTLLPLMRFIESTPDKLIANTSPVESFRDLAARASLLLSRPAILHDGRHYVPCFDALFNRCLRDIPYLSRELYQLDFSNQCARWFGAMLEGYVTWLLKEILRNTSIEVVGPYEFEGKEKDIILRLGDTVIALEIKSAIPAEQLQISGEWNDFVANLKHGTEQAFHAAQGINQGKASVNGKLICPPQLVVPVVLTFEAYPFRFPIAREFEKRMEWQLKHSVFCKQRVGIAPLQYLDVQQIELLDQIFDFSHEPQALFELLTRRAYSDEDRHSPLSRVAGSHAVNAEGMMDKLVADAEKVSFETLKQLSNIAS